MLDPDEQDRLREMEEWIMKGEGTWVLAESFNTFLGRVLHDPALPSEGRVAMVRLLAFGASNDDIVLILHSDRKDHLVMNWAQTIDKMPIKEQEACALFVSSGPAFSFTPHTPSVGLVMGLTYKTGYMRSY